MSKVDVDLELKELKWKTDKLLDLFVSFTGAQVKVNSVSDERLSRVVDCVNTLLELGGASYVKQSSLKIVGVV